MSQINVIEVPTPHGIKTVEVHHDDITQLPMQVDLLVVSAFRRSYIPSPNTVIADLEENMGIPVAELAASPLLDLRNSMNCWISEEIKDKSISYLGCVEHIAGKIIEVGAPDDVISNLFGAISMLFYKGINITTIAMPILGAGLQGASLEKVLPVLVESSINALKHNHSLKTIYLVEHSMLKAKSIDDEINRLQERTEDNLELVIDQSYGPILDEILSKLILIKDTPELLVDSDTLTNLIQHIQDKDLRFFELGILSRTLTELILQDMLNEEDHSYTLFESIMELKERNVTNWMLGHLHIIRIFGNSLVHEAAKGIPVNMTSTDVLVLLYALNRSLDLAINHRHELKK